MGYMTLLGAGSPSGFSPSSIADLSLWLRADQGITKGLDDKVSAWADQSPLARDVSQSTEINKPTHTLNAINGLPAVTFNRTHVLQGVVDGGGPSTISWVQRTSFSGNDNRVFDFNGGAWFHIQNLNGDDRPFLLAQASNYRFFAAAAQLRNGQPHVCTLNISGIAQNDILSSQFYADGVAIANSTTITTGTPVAWTQFSLGARTALTASTGFAGDIPEFVRYSRVLTTQERQQTEAYLASRYGIAI